MGFGFNLFFALFLAPFSLILFAVWLFSGKKIFGFILLSLWGGIFALSIFSGIIQKRNAKIELSKEDYYGEYVIDRTKFPGYQADWQYNHFRFELTSYNEIHFHITDNQKILKTYIGRFSTVVPYNSARLSFVMQQPTHHILNSNPTTYRVRKEFYLVFYSPKFDNVFFKKGKWEAIN